MRRSFSILFAILLSFAAGDLAAQAETPPADEAAAAAVDVERLVQTLEDPAARERLVGDLKLLLDAQQDDGAAEPSQPILGPGGTIDLVTGIIEDFWDRLTSIDPKEVAVSSMISFGILIAALLLRWLLLSMIRRLYARLARDSSDDEETGKAAAKKR